MSAPFLSFPHYLIRALHARESEWNGLAEIGRQNLRRVAQLRHPAVIGRFIVNCATVPLYRTPLPYPSTVPLFIFRVATLLGILLLARPLRVPDAIAVILDGCRKLALFSEDFSLVFFDLALSRSFPHVPVCPLVVNCR